jgi:hypothetical protein
MPPVFGKEMRRRAWDAASLSETPFFVATWVSDGVSFSETPFFVPAHPI